MLNSKYRKRLFGGVSALSLVIGQLQPTFAAVPVPLAPNDGNTATPIKHVIIIVGENRTFDQVFGTYTPQSGQTVNNLLSEGIVNADGTAGPNFSKAVQNQATDTDTYRNAPTTTGPYATLPPPTTGSLATAPSDTKGPPFASLAFAEQADYGLFPQDLRLLLTGATGLPAKSIDTRIANVKALPSGPFPLVSSTGDSLYDAYLESPVHRFYQMWQQLDCSASHVTAGNPSGCLADLFPWVEVTVGAGSNGAAQATNFTDQTTGEGSTSMGFFNVAKGDMPFFKQLADQYAISDNYHQPVMGGTGANSIMIGAADAYYYTDGKGNATTPPAGQIENPNPQPGTNNFYAQDGYGTAGSGGGSYTNCSDTSQPGVAPVVTYLQSLPNQPAANCAPGHFYLLNNYNP
ncbi:MAG: phosphoesterase, partial [Pseudomonadota bacterium]|nr:phosphoesterase [Pseudomonadota bacterium]